MADQMLIIPMLASLDEPLGTDKDLSLIHI